jgi:hypothetical protein
VRPPLLTAHQKADTEPGEVLIFETFKYAWDRMVELTRSGTTLCCKGLLLRQSPTLEGEIEAQLDIRALTEGGLLPPFWALVEDRESPNELFRWLGFSRWDPNVVEALRTMRQIATVSS